MSLRELLIEIAGGWVQAKSEPFTGHPIATLLRQDLSRAIEDKLQSPTDYLIKASAGAGNWADVPWLSILNPQITESTQSG
ncbi:MrcB family domain-containing protein, partial [Vibrio hibernica]|uniref:MrcB family domain-containing protein n=1 Tax=Vibrio hibernica TaxID=2587465 RepID=UPI00187F9339